MPITRDEALRQLAPLAIADGKELAKTFCDLVPQIEDDNLILELLGLFAGGEVSPETASLAWALISSVNNKRKMESDFAERLPDRFPWKAQGKTVPDVDDVMERNQFRGAVIALARSALV